jgi:predicted nucleotidyltransferase
MITQRQNDPSIEQIKKRLAKSKAALAERYGVRSFALFGSYVRGEADANSDVDILVEYVDPPSFFQFVRLQHELCELLGAPVDLVMKSALRPTLGVRILSEAVEL